MSHLRVLHSEPHLAHGLSGDASSLVGLKVLKYGVVDSVDHELAEVVARAHVADLNVLAVCQQYVLAVKKVFRVCKRKVVGREILQQEDRNDRDNQQENIDQQRLEIRVWVIDPVEFLGFFGVVAIVGRLVRVFVHEHFEVPLLGLLHVLLLAEQVVVFGLPQLFF